MFKVIRQSLLVMLVAAIIFLAIYFFYPSVSMKFFGIAYGDEKEVVSALMDNPSLTEEEKTELSEIIESDEGDDFISALMEATRKGVSGVKELLNTMSGVVAN